MADPGSRSLLEAKELRDRTGVFRDRAHAGEVLADLLAEYRASEALVLAIPAGGVPVAARMAEVLGLELDVAVVSKITLPWNTEVGCGAVAFDGTVRLNESLVRAFRLSEDDVQEGIAHTRAKVARRVREFRGNRPVPTVKGREAFLVDDGLASGFTMEVAVGALRAAGAVFLGVAVPTGHRNAVERLAPLVTRLICANIRSGRSFAVADAYRTWKDVPEEEVKALLERFASPGP